jgi:pimeloyl-ACP methyl ester carboxylesterase
MSTQRNAGIAGAALAAVTTLGLATAKGIAVRDRRRSGTSKRAALVAASLTDPSDAIHHYLVLRDGAKIHVVERSPRRTASNPALDSPTVVLLHGVTLSTRVWHHSLDVLGDEFRTIAIDWRGHGRSLAGDLGYGLDVLATDLAEVLNQLDIHDAVIVGHSMGGMALMHFCGNHPAILSQRVSGLMFLSTACADVGVAALPAALHGAVRGLLTKPLVARRASWTLPGDLGYTMVRATFGEKPSAAWVEHARNIVAEMDPNATSASIIPLLSHDATHILPGITIATMVVVGTADRVTPLAQARKTASLIDGAELIEVDGAGHLIMLERQARFHALVRALATRAGLPQSLRTKPDAAR